MHETNLKRFIDLFSQFTKIPKKELKEYLKEEQDIVNLFKSPSSFTSDPLKIKKIQDLNELRVTMNVNANINRKSIGSPEDVYNHLIMYGEKKGQEYFLALFLDAKNSIIKTKEINIGTHNASLIDVKGLAKQALMHDSTSIIVAHNHPSGIAKPSNEDIAITKRLYNALKILDIDLLDHVIIGNNSFVSLKEQGVFDIFPEYSNHLSQNKISYNNPMKISEEFSLDDIRQPVMEPIVEFVRDKLKEADINDVGIVNIQLYGSRTNGTNHKHSDLDVLVEFSGNIREDDFFNLLNGDPLIINGIKVDINPITARKSGTIEQFLNSQNKNEVVNSNVVQTNLIAFPDTKYINENTAKIIAKLNKGRDVPLTVKEVRQRHKELGKRLEQDRYSKEDLQEFKDLQDIVDDFKNAQLKEKSKPTKNQVSKEIKVQSPSFDI